MNNSIIEKLQTKLDAYNLAPDKYWERCAIQDCIKTLKNVAINGIVVIEDIQKDGSSECGLSFNGYNPEQKEFVQTRTIQIAFELKEFLSK